MSYILIFIREVTLLIYQCHIHFNIHNRYDTLYVQYVTYILIFDNRYDTLYLQYVTLTKHYKYVNYTPIPNYSK